MSVQGPHDSMSQLAEQMNWLAQLMNSEFWQQIQSGMDTTRTPGQRMGLPRRSLGPTAPNNYPPLEIYVTPDEVVLSASLPGASPQTIAASLTTPSELVLEAFVPPEAVSAPLLRERFTGYCARTITLPAPVRGTGGTATYEGGIVELRLPRLQPGTADDGVALLKLEHHP